MEKTLLEEDNIISLRTAYVIDDGKLVGFRLMPAELDVSKAPGCDWHKPKDCQWYLQDQTYLYRHTKSPKEEEEMIIGFDSWQQSVKPMCFEKPPRFKLLWADSGNTVALYLNGEPWALIHEETREGYSKGLLKSDVGNPWSEELFRQIFRVR